MEVYDLFRSRVLLGFFILILWSTISVSQTVIPISEKRLDSLISARNGNILLLNIWATWCEPCKEEFPDLIKLSSVYKNKKVHFAAISVDYPDDINEKIIPFLDSLKVPFPIFVSDFISQDTMINTLNSDWSGAVPATFIYDTKGKLRKFLFGRQAFNQLKRAVDDIMIKP